MERAEIDQPEARVNIGIRVSPELKETLGREAIELGQTSSEYGEAILHNRHSSNSEIAQLKQIIEDQNKVIEEMKLERVMLQGNHTEELLKHKKTIETLKAQLTKPVEQSSILKDARLLYLFQQLQGRTDTVKDPYAAHFSIVYNTPETVLKALIYCSKLNT